MTCPSSYSECVEEQGVDSKGDILVPLKSAGILPLNSRGPGFHFSSLGSQSPSVLIIPPRDGTRTQESQFTDPSPFTRHMPLSPGSFSSASLCLLLCSYGSLVWREMALLLEHAKHLSCDFCAHAPLSTTPPIALPLSVSNGRGEISPYYQRLQGGKGDLIGCN